MSLYDKLRFIGKWIVSMMWKYSLCYVIGGLHYSLTPMEVLTNQSLSLPWLLLWL